MREESKHSLSVGGGAHACDASCPHRVVNVQHGILRVPGNLSILNCKGRKTLRVAPPERSHMSSAHTPTPI